MTYSPMAFFPANFMLQTGHNDEHHQQSLTTSFHTFQDFQGVSPNELGKRSMSSFSGFEAGGEVEPNMEDDLSDDGMQSLGEKKKRLNMVQVKTLEKSFELGNKLEPERKMQLARALGLQPRQIAIWFQNRRARWKTKQLEKDYEILKRQFDAIKQENDALQDKNQKLHAEIMALKNRQENIESINLNKETDQGSCSNRSTTDHQQQQQSCDMNLNINNSRTVPSPVAIDNNSPLPTTPPPPPHHHHDPPMSLNSRPFFTNNNNNNNRPITGNSPPQFFHNFNNLQQNSKMHMDNVNVAVKEESLCNLFGFDQQDHQANSSGFWPWMEQQHYN